MVAVELGIVETRKGEQHRRDIVIGTVQGASQGKRMRGARERGEGQRGGRSFPEMAIIVNI